MPVYAKKGTFGFREIDEDTAFSSDDPVFIVLDKDSYDQMQDNLRKIILLSKKYKKELEDQKQKLNDSNQLINRFYVENKTLEDMLAEQRQHVNILQQKLTNLQNECDSEKNLNCNLLRIARERANASRKIVPKKRHDGYMIVWSQGYRQSYYHTLSDEEVASIIGSKNAKPYKKELRNQLVYKTLISAPYAATLPAESAEKQMFEDMQQENGLFQSIGIDGITSENNQVEILDSDYEQNAIYAWECRANYKTGLWEVFLYTTKPIRPVENRLLKKY